MPSAYVSVLKRPPYHGDRMEAGLRRLGYDVLPAKPGRIMAGDVLLIWNRYPREEVLASAYERAGASVIVVENGYFGRNFNGAEWYAMALGQHNGCGILPPPSSHRWASLGVDLDGWRLGGREIVILASRNLGSPSVREPVGWAEKTASRLRRVVNKHVRIRRHPGPQAQCLDASLADDLIDAWAAVTWGSGAGLKALTLGVPVFHGLPRWIGRRAARQIEACLTPNDTRFTGDRRPMFHQIASAMWSIGEIESGEAFRCLLGAR